MGDMVEKKESSAGAKVDSQCFWLERVFPDASAGFSFQQRSVEEIKEKCIVILDANVLLMPYRLGAHSLGELKSVYRDLAEKKRLAIPAQAAREFLRNRGNRVRDISRELSKQASQIFVPFEKQVGFLDADADFTEVKKLAKKIAELKSDIIKKVAAVGSKLTSDIGADPVSAAYQEIFKDAVVELELKEEDRAALLSEMSWRYDHDIPPGYKDDDKLDGGIGDLLIWKTILKLGADRKSDAIFVTEDAKSDWWVQSEGAFQPRIELVEEYRLASNGQTIELMPLSSLLKLFGAEQGSVEEAKQVESARRAREALIAERNRQENLSVEAGGVTTEEEIDGDLPSLILLNQQLWKRLNEVTLELSRLRRRMNEQGENLSPVELAQAFDRRDSLSAEQTSLFRRRREIEERMRRLAK